MSLEKASVPGPFSSLHPASTALVIGPKRSKQSPNTCSACRARKVRCDGRREVCTNCQRLGHTCSFVAPEAARLPVRRRRAHVACLACHSRKIRCNEGRPSCRRCARLGLCCTYPTAEPTLGSPSENEPHASSLTQQQATRHADDSFQVDYVLPELLNHGLPQDYLRQSPKSPTEITAETQGLATDAETQATENNIELSQRHLEATLSSVSPLEPSQQLIMMAFKLFFTHFRHIPVFSFLHKASVMDQYRNELLDKAVILSLIGIVSVYADLGPGMKERGPQYIAEAEILVLRDIEKPTLSKVQALVFIIKHRAFCRRFSSVFMLMAIANRFAMGLRLNYEDSELSTLARESCRRTMWSLYLIDTVVSAGYPDFALSSPDLLHIQLPSHDSNFDMDVTQAAEYLQTPSDSDCGNRSSALAMTIRVMYLRYRTLQFTKHAVSPRNTGSDLKSSITTLQKELDDFLARLPTQLQLSEYNIKLQTHSPTLSNFLTIHITWHGSQCILYRLTLDGFMEALPRDALSSLDPCFVKACQQRCIENAKSVADILGVILSMKPEMIPLDLDIAVSIYECLRILIHSYGGLVDVLLDNVDIMAHCRSCIEFLKTMFFDCEAISAIRRDADVLVETAFSSFSNIQRDNDIRLEQTDKNTEYSFNSRHHVLSRHSMVGQIEIPDNSKNFLLSPLTRQVPPNHVQTTSFIPDPSPQTRLEPITRATDSPPLDISDLQFQRLFGSGLPEFGLDSSILLPQSWLNFPEQDI